MTTIPAVQPALNESEEKMKKSIDRLKQEFAGLRTGRVTATLLDHLKVDYYGSHVPLKQVAAVSAPEGRTLEWIGRNTRWLRPKERQEILTDLEANRLITLERVPTGKRPKTVVKRCSKQRRKAS
jgi:hypothetical protein